MGTLYFVLFVLMVLGIGVPFVLSYYIYKFVKWKKLDKKFYVLTLIPLIGLGFYIYHTFYPPDSFFKDDFKEVTGLAFPEDGKIMYEHATFPDKFGNYTSVVLIRTSNAFCNRLETHIYANGFRQGQEKWNYSEVKKTLNKAKHLKLTKGFTVIVNKRRYFYVGFLSDNQSVIVEKVTW